MSGALYAAATTLAAPALRVMLRRRVRSGKEVAARLPEREGVDATSRPPGRLLWLHAASMGESQSVLPVLVELSSTPDLSILMTTGTATSAALLAERLAALGLARVQHRFVPLDVPRWAARFLDHWRPDAAAFVESELWPNLLAACRRRGIPTMLVNARLSPKSFRGWQRAPGLARRMVGGFARIHPQSEGDADRLRSLGARNVDAPGNLKRAGPPLPVDADELARLQALLHGRPVWLAASTHPGEEAVAAEVHQALAAHHPRLLTIIAPRHPARGPALAAAFAAPRRGAGQGPPDNVGLWIVDTMGELGLLFRLAPIVFLGRSLTAQGGHNPLEPARLRCAIAMGPHTANAADSVRLLYDAGALTTVDDAAALASFVGAMLDDPAARTAAGEAAHRVATADQALPAQIAQALLSLMPPP